MMFAKKKKIIDELQSQIDDLRQKFEEADRLRKENYGGWVQAREERVKIQSRLEDELAESERLRDKHFKCWEEAREELNTTREKLEELRGQLDERNQRLYVVTVFYGNDDVVANGPFKDRHFAEIFAAGRGTDEGSVVKIEELSPEDAYKSLEDWPVMKREETNVLAEVVRSMNARQNGKGG